MKKIVLLSILAVSLIPLIRAGVIVLGGNSGATINAMSLTNFPMAPQVGTFYMTAPVYLNYNAISNAGGMLVYGRVSLDGTNFVNISQTYTNSLAETNLNNQLYQVSLALPIYGSLTVSNNTAWPITNFSGFLQQ